MPKKHIRFHEYNFMYCAGSVIYAAAEVAFRGFTHWTMVITGGLCAVLIHFFNKKLRNKTLLLRCAISVGIITAMEFNVGCVVNLFLKWKVWDYSERYLNLLGQICPLFTAMWLPLALIALFISGRIADTFRGYLEHDNTDAII